MRRFLAAAAVILAVVSAAPAAETETSVAILIERYDADRALLDRFHDAPGSELARVRRLRLFDEQVRLLDALDFDRLDADQQLDAILLRRHLDFGRREIERERIRDQEIADLVPFASHVVGLHEARRAMEPVDARLEAGRLAALAETLATLAGDVRDGALTAPAPSAYRASRRVRALSRTLRGWYAFHAEYDPTFTWWMQAPYEDVRTALDDYATAIDRTLVGIAEGDEDDAIIGDPIGRDALIDHLRHEMIPYSPEELVAIARQEYAWCLNEMLAASRALGFGEDWKAALDYVKTLHVEPGRQPDLIRDLAHEAIAFLEARDLVTIPALCKETWRMSMMSPERQRVSPYFLGGETIIVSYPTHAMSHDEKLMSMRGNNVHFARATVQHELIPGHHLQGFMTRRYRPHRRVFRTPFWIEGWALYWEMRLWDLGFPETPENRVGMLFWRTHRCARIVFSLSFHLGTMSPAEAIDYLVENVGHERANATAEVRRSVSGDYGPLYQAAYMLGGLQVRALHGEQVGSGRMTERAFHDAILKENAIPIELIRARLRGDRLEREMETTWRFYGEVDVDE